MVQDGLRSLWAEFLLLSPPPPFYPGSGYATFVLVATFNSVALSVIQLSKSFQHEHVCQNHRTFVFMTMHECEEQL